MQPLHLRLKELSSAAKALFEEWLRAYPESAEYPKTDDPLNSLSFDPASYVSSLLGPAPTSGQIADAISDVNSRLEESYRHLSESAITSGGDLGPIFSSTEMLNDLLSEVRMICERSASSRKKILSLCDGFERLDLARHRMSEIISVLSHLQSASESLDRLSQRRTNPLGLDDLAQLKALQVAWSALLPYAHIPRVAEIASRRSTVISTISQQVIVASSRILHGPDQTKSPETLLELAVHLGVQESALAAFSKAQLIDIYKDRKRIARHGGGEAMLVNHTGDSAHASETAIGSTYIQPIMPSELQFILNWIRLHEGVLPRPYISAVISHFFEIVAIPADQTRAGMISLERAVQFAARYLADDLSEGVFAGTLVRAFADHAEPYFQQLLQQLTDHLAALRLHCEVIGTGNRYANATDWFQAIAAVGRDTKMLNLLPREKTESFHSQLQMHIVAYADWLGQKLSEPRQQPIATLAKKGGLRTEALESRIQAACIVLNTADLAIGACAKIQDLLTSEEPAESGSKITRPYLLIISACRKCICRATAEHLEPHFLFLTSSWPVSVEEEFLDVSPAASEMVLILRNALLALATYCEESKSHSQHRHIAVDQILMYVAQRFETALFSRPEQSSQCAQQWMADLEHLKRVFAEPKIGTRPSTSERAFLRSQTALKLLWVPRDLFMETLRVMEPNADDGRIALLRALVDDQSLPEFLEIKNRTPDAILDRLFEARVGP